MKLLNSQLRQIRERLRGFSLDEHELLQLASGLQCTPVKCFWTDFDGRLSLSLIAILTELRKLKALRVSGASMS